MITVETLEQALPVHLDTAASRKLVDRIRGASRDTRIVARIEQTFLENVGLLEDGQYDLEDCVDAVIFVSFRAAGVAPLDSFNQTFPGRYMELSRSGVRGDGFMDHIAAYYRGPLVQALLQKVMAPGNVADPDPRQEAVRTLAQLMQTSESEQIQLEAAKSLLDHLKAPANA